MDTKKRKKRPKTITVGRRFFLYRKNDPSGVSGKGRVAFGVELPSGRVTFEWTAGKIKSQETFASMEECLKIHGHGKDTKVEYVDQLRMEIKSFDIEEGEEVLETNLLPFVQS